MDKETDLRMELRWARLKVRMERKEKPSTVNILVGARSYELQMWWEAPPWVVGVFPLSKEVLGEVSEFMQVETEEEGEIPKVKDEVAP